MEIKVDDELRQLVERIANEKKSIAEWSEIESDDMYQSTHYVGGFDADEREFCFSFFDDTGAEYWFQFDLNSVNRILDGTISSVNGRRAGR